MSIDVFVLDDDPDWIFIIGELMRWTDTSVAGVSDVAAGKDLFMQMGDVYDLYLLDMCGYLDRVDGPSYRAGPEMRKFLIEQGVGKERIILMSNHISENDNAVAQEYNLNPKTMIEKGDLVDELDQLFQ